MKSTKFTLTIVLFLVCLSYTQAQSDYNPWAKYGYTPPKALTLSNGKYQEFFDDDTIVQIGSIMFNTITNQIVGFVKQDTTYSEATLEPHIISRWLSPDPMAKERESLTPYNFVSNNPIMRIDPNGALDGDYYSKNGDYLGSDGKNDDKVYTVENHSYSSTPDGKKSYAMLSGVTELKNPDGTSFSHKQFQALAGTLYAESSPGSTNYKESAGIYSVLENRAKAVGTTPFDIASNPSTYGIYGWGERDKINSIFAPKESVKSAYKGLIAGMTQSTDFSGGATYWHGTDFGENGSRANKEFYKVGFKFTNPSHDLWDLGNRQSGNKNFNYKYQSTGAIGGTTFMKLTDEWKTQDGYKKPY